MTEDQLFEQWKADREAEVEHLNAEQFIPLVIRAIEAKVREECAVICEGIAFTVKTVGTDEHGLVADACAKAIRARGKNE